MHTAKAQKKFAVEFQISSLLIVVSLAQKFSNNFFLFLHFQRHSPHRDESEWEREGKRICEMRCQSLFLYCTLLYFVYRFLNSNNIKSREIKEEQKIYLQLNFFLPLLPLNLRQIFHFLLNVVEILMNCCDTSRTKNLRI